MWGIEENKGADVRGPTGRQDAGFNVGQREDLMQRRKRETHLWRVIFKITTLFFKVTTRQVVFLILQIKILKSVLRQKQHSCLFKLGSRASFLVHIREMLNPELNSLKLTNKLSQLKTWVWAMSGPRIRSVASPAEQIYSCLYRTFVFPHLHAVAWATPAWRQTTVFTQTQRK